MSAEVQKRNFKFLQTSEPFASSRQKLNDGLKGLPDPTP